MKSGFLGRFIGTATAVFCLAAALSGCGSSDSSSVTDSSTASAAGNDNSSVETDSAAGKEGTVLTEVTQGIEDGYNYELWKDSGDTTMTLGAGGAFSCEWSNINNALFRRGIKFSDSKPYQEHGDITIDYGVDYQPDGNSYLCVYGWTKSPLIEYYIVESWGDWRPPGQSYSLGTVYSDGGQYDIYKTTRENAPSIDGDTNNGNGFMLYYFRMPDSDLNISVNFKSQKYAMTVDVRDQAAFDVVDDGALHVEDGAGVDRQVFEAHRLQLGQHHVHHAVAVAQMVMERDAHPVFQPRAEDSVAERAYNLAVFHLRSPPLMASAMAIVCSARRTIGLSIILPCSEIAPRPCSLA